MSDLTCALAAAAKGVESLLDGLFPLDDIPEARLIEAMRYSMLGGGKRIRPFLLMQSADLFGVYPDHALHAAAAVEMIHCYSLVHDDLPAMDDDDMRRGRPTCHVAFDEATAILAGDALLTGAFELLTSEKTHPNSAVRCELVAALSKAAGAQGMVGGQMLDLAAENAPLGVPEITRLQRLKTGCLIAASCEMGGILGRAPDSARTALHHYAHDLGLAFQIADDLLDVEGDEAETGKKVRKDTNAGKATFVSLLGIERAREQGRLLAEQAAGHLDIFDEKANLLRKLTDFVVERRS
ncbi:MAG: polyprenyl synthetase family protein [Rhodospirillales bacterium]|nr:polyprenyl synthetase family protein [Rhodospirillales bacterium]MCW9001481.1 polyprenyl synthetase family protein [Rhodospirillales bacterium]